MPWFRHSVQNRDAARNVWMAMLHVSNGAWRALQRRLYVKDMAEKAPAVDGPGRGSTAIKSDPCISADRARRFHTLLMSARSTIDFGNPYRFNTSSSNRHQHCELGERCLPKVLV